jgi:8-oxo-dGTP pyrophosphatase MutT (NUDIX family)
MRIINRNIVSAIIISKDKKIFFGRKKAGGGGVYSDCWHLPGGGIDTGETKNEALEREILEETGIDISKYKIELIDEEGEGESEKTLKDTGEKVLCKMKFFVYRIVINDKESSEIEIKLDDDLVKYRWARFEDLVKIEKTPPGIKLFKRLGYF